MDCNSNHDLFLRANGSLVCWDDYGSLKILQKFDPKLDYGTAVYLGGISNYIRNKLKKEEMPFPEFCSKCYCLRHDIKYNPYYIYKREIDVLQIEPTILCQLRCSYCVPYEERKLRIFPPYVLDKMILEKIILNFKENSININTIDFQGHGEPLLNNDIWYMIQLVKKIYPNTKVSMCTNANSIFKPEYIQSGIDEIVFAIDGISQETYEPYRINGDFDKAYEFMKRFSHEAKKSKSKIKIVWKYVLFKHNDSVDNLIKAQKLAKEAKVTELRFIITQAGPKSTLIYDSEQIPRLHHTFKFLHREIFLNVVNYKVDYDNLIAGIHEASIHRKNSNFIESANGLKNVATMLTRLFNNRNEINEKYKNLINELILESNNLPKSIGEEVMVIIKHLIK